MGRGGDVLPRTTVVGRLQVRCASGMPLSVLACGPNLFVGFTLVYLQSLHCTALCITVVLVAYTVHVISVRAVSVCASGCGVPGNRSTRSVAEIRSASIDEVDERWRSMCATRYIGFESYSGVILGVDVAGIVK